MYSFMTNEELDQLAEMWKNSGPQRLIRENKELRFEVDKLCDIALQLIMSPESKAARRTVTNALDYYEDKGLWVKELS